MHECKQEAPGTVRHTICIARDSSMPSEVSRGSLLLSCHCEFATAYGHPWCHWTFVFLARPVSLRGRVVILCAEAATTLFTCSGLRKLYAPG